MCFQCLQKDDIKFNQKMGNLTPCKHVIYSSRTLPKSSSGRIVEKIIFRDFKDTISKDTPSILHRNQACICKEFEIRFYLNKVSHLGLSVNCESYLP